MKNGISQAAGFVSSLSGLCLLLRQPVFLGGVLFLGLAGFMWLRILATQELSTSYPLFVSLTYFLITVSAVYFLHERISPQKLVGLVTIVVGITVVARG